MLAEAIADCISAFIDEAFESRAAEGAEVGAGLSFHAIVTGARDADIMGTIDVIDADVVWATTVDVRAARAIVRIEVRMLMDILRL